MMTGQEHLLACLIEECAEVSHRCCKALRFGIDDKDPTVTQATTERMLISSELDDLLAVVEMLYERGILKRNNSQAEAILAKKEKVLKFMTYAKAAGVLQ